MKNLKIAIPEPCYEDWNKMSYTEKGKFCNSCTKEVFDFTAFSDEQLIKQFEKEGDLCGRFTTNQLNRNLTLQRKKSHDYISYAFSGIFSLLLLNTNPSKAQEKPKTTQTNKNFVSIPLQNTRVTDSITVSGTVFDESNITLPGVTIIIKGTSTGTSTDFDGKFNLKCSKNDTLILSYVGYFEQEILVNKNIRVNLKLDKSLGDVIVTALGYVRKQHEIKRPLKIKDSLKKSKIVTGGIQRKKHSIPQNKKLLNQGRKRWIGGNLFTRFMNIFRKQNKNPRFNFKEQ